MFCDLSQKGPFCKRNLLAKNGSSYFPGNNLQADLNFKLDPPTNFNENTRAMCEIYSKLTTKTPERRLRRRPSVFIVNFVHISYIH